MKDYLRETAYKFLRAVAAEYGEEEALRLFKVIGEEVSEDITKRLLYVMLQNDLLDSVILVDLNNACKIAAIKAVRTSTDLSLKESKDLIETPEKTGESIEVPCSNTKRVQWLRQEFSRLGIKFS